MSNGVSVGRVLVGLVVGIAGSVTLANAITWVLDRWFARPPTLRKHELREEPQLVVEVADFVDSIGGAREWTSEQDSKLESIWEERSLDEDLVNQALIAAKELRSRLRDGDEPVKHRTGEIRSLTLDELRLELAAIARDLRVAAQ